MCIISFVLFDFRGVEMNKNNESNEAESTNENSTGKRKFKINKKLGIILASIGVVGIILLWATLIGILKGSGKKYVAPLPSVVVQKPVLGTVTESITISGYVEARTMVPVVPFVNGTILNYSAKAGEFVKKDTILAKIDDAPYRQQFLQAQAAFLGYKSSFDRVAGLYKSGATTQQNYDTIKAQYEAAKAQYDLAKLQMDYTEVKASVDGTILVADMGVGSIGTTTAPIAILADLNDLVVRLKVPEKYFDLFQLQKDKIEVTVTRPGIEGMYEDAVAAAQVETIAPYVNAESKNFAVVCRILNSGERFRPGMFVKITAAYNVHSNVYVLPVTTRKLDGSCYIFNEEDSTVKYLMLDKIVADNNNFLVDQEYADTWFVVDGQNTVFDGQKVRLAKDVEAELFGNQNFQEDLIQQETEEDKVEYKVESKEREQ